MALTARMTEALLRMEERGGTGSAYALRVSLATMDALSLRGLIRPHATIGWIFSPRTCDWRITEDGKRVAANLKAEQNGTGS